MVRCPECNTILSVPPDISLYDRIYCEECGALLEVIGLDPILLEYVPDFEDEEMEWEEDWEEEEDFFEEALDEEW